MAFPQRRKSIKSGPPRTSRKLRGCASAKAGASGGCRCMAQWSFPIPSRVQSPPISLRPMGLDRGFWDMVTRRGSGGGVRWCTFVWQMIPADDEAARARIMLHELFHRVQPQLGLLITSIPGELDHLDTLEGRHWMQLEWRALTRALDSSGAGCTEALRDALAFRMARRTLFPGSTE